MSKQKQQSLQSKQIGSINYRITRTSSFGWCPWKVTAYADGSFSEEIAFKEDTLDIVMRKLALQMREDGNDEFKKKKTNAI